MGRKSINKKRKDNPDKKREWVMQLIPFFQEKGLKAVTMDEVADYLNKSKATIYKYFKSREEIIAHGLAYKLEEIQYFEQILTDDSIPYLDRYFKSIEHLSIQIADISNLFLSDLKHVFPDIWKRVTGFIDYAIDIIRDYYQKGIESGIFNNIDPSLMVMSDRYFFATLSDPDFLIKHDMTIQHAFQQYFTMKFFGIVKDPKLLKPYQHLIRTNE